MVKRSRRKSRAGMRASVSSPPDNIMEGMMGEVDEGVVLGNEIQRELEEQLRIDTTRAEANTMVDDLFDSRQYKPRITEIYGMGGVTGEIKFNAKEWARRHIRRLAKKEEDKLIHSQRSLKISNKKDKGKVDGITDLAPDLADMISFYLRQTKVPHGVSVRWKQEQARTKKKKKKQKKQTRKKKRRSTRD